MYDGGSKTITRAVQDSATNWEIAIFFKLKLWAHLLFKYFFFFIRKKCLIQNSIFISALFRVIFALKFIIASFFLLWSHEIQIFHNWLVKITILINFIWVRNVRIMQILIIMYFFEIFWSLTNSQLCGSVFLQVNGRRSSRRRWISFVN